jgi:hypothetical protein
MKNFGALVLGVFIGTLCCAVLRVLQYKIRGWEPNMAPEMFILFAPVLACPVAVVALIAHFTFRSTFVYATSSQWLVAGLCYSSVFLLLITPWLFLVVILLNVFTLKKLRRLR